MKTTAIFGPPGTGKTTKLCGIIRGMWDDGLKVAVLSFSKAAADRLIDDLQPVPGSFIGTVHSLCYQSIGLNKHAVMKPKEFAEKTGLNVPEVEYIVSLKSRAFQTGKPLEECWAESVHLLEDHIRVGNVDDIRAYLTFYNRWKRTNSIFDFDDMLTEGVGTIKPFDVVIVDEAQDLSIPMWFVIESIQTGQLIMAGDDDQSIYTFNGARPCLMAAMATEKEILAQSYRLPREVFKYAQSLIDRVKNREPKEYRPRDADGELGFMGESYLDFISRCDKPHTVLGRDKWVLGEAIEILQMLGVPYTIEGGGAPFTSRRADMVRAVRRADAEFIEENMFMLDPATAEEFKTNGRLPVDLPIDMIFDPNKIPEVWLEYMLRVDLDAEPKVHLSTIHGFKGKEADNVVVLTGTTAAVEDAHGNEEAFENEMRVWYTAVTRAKESLTVLGTNGFLTL